MRPSLPAVATAPTTRPTQYAPGRIRRATDAERDALTAFVLKHPEFAGLADDEIAQCMDTYRTEEEHAEARLLADEGVDPEWGAGRAGARWSDDA